MKKTKQSSVVLRLLVFAALLLTTTVSLNAGEAEAIEQQKVYVVMSNMAHAYHSNKDCKGLRNATHTIKQVTVQEAKEMGRQPCKICYGN